MCQHAALGCCILWAEGGPKPGLKTRREGKRGRGGWCLKKMQPSWPLPWQPEKQHATFLSAPPRMHAHAVLLVWFATSLLSFSWVESGRGGIIEFNIVTSDVLRIKMKVPSCASVRVCFYQAHQSLQETTWPSHQNRLPLFTHEEAPPALF